MFSMMLLALFLFFQFAVASSDSKCTLDTPKGKIYVYGAAASSGQYDFSTHDFAWSLQICDSVKSKSCSGGIKSPVIRSPVTAPFDCETYLGKTENYEVMALDPNAAERGVKIRYVGGQTINLYSFDFETNSVIEINCDPEVKKESEMLESFQYVGDTIEGSTDVFVFSMRSAYACPGVKPKSRLPLGQFGVGGLLIVLGIIAFVLYCVIGMLVCRFACKKTACWEIIPQGAFWKSFPLLIWDGIRFIGDGIMFIVAKIRGCCGKDEGGSVSIGGGESSAAMSSGASDTRGYQSI